MSVGAVAAALTGALLGAPSWATVTAGTGASERYAAKASAQVLDLSLLGRRIGFGSTSAESELEAVGEALTASATALGTSLVPSGTSTVARRNDPSAPGGRSCATPALEVVLDQLGGKLPGLQAAMLPSVDLGVACGEARVTGDPRTFQAEGTGGGSEIGLRLPGALSDLVGQVRGVLGPDALGAPLEDLVDKSSAPISQQALGVLGGLFDRLVPGVTLPDLIPRQLPGRRQTVDSLLSRLQDAELLRIRLGSAKARNTGDSTTYLSEALSEGGSIQVLPGLRGPGQGPLLGISVAGSRTAVNIDRAAGAPKPTVENVLVRIESDLLDAIPIGGPAVIDGLVNGLPLGSVLGGDLPVIGGILGSGLPLDRLTKSLGLVSGPDYLELRPGQSVSIFCEGPIAPLCSEVSVSPAKEPVVAADGSMRAEASTVSVHLFKGLDSLTQGANLAGALGGATVGSAIAPLAAAAGIDPGQTTEVRGIQLSLVGAAAEAGAQRVLEAHKTLGVPVRPPASSTLPRTGGLPHPALSPLLLGAAAGTRMLLGRRR